MAVVAIPLLLLSALAYPTIQNVWHARTFDAAAWRAAKHDADRAWPMRLRMVDDLTAHQRLVGLGRRELIALLGQPDDVTTFRGRSRRPDNLSWDVAYELGPERGPIVRIDNEWLLFDLDRAGRVQRFIVTHD